MRRDADVSEVIEAARRRARALAERDVATLTALHHPELRWTTFRGDALDRDAYVRGNTADELVWHAQRLEEPAVVVVGDTAFLTAVVHDVVEREGVAEALSLRLTQTWVRSGNGWSCLAGHAGPRLGTG